MNRIALFLVLIASLANGQDFKATLRWMHNTASYDGGGYHGGDKTMMDGTEIPLTNTCRKFVVIQTTHYFTDPPKPDHVWRIEMDLSTIDPKTIEFDPVEGTGEKKGERWAYVNIETTNDEDAIKVPDRRTAGVGLYFNNSDF